MGGFVFELDALRIGIVPVFLVPTLFSIRSRAWASRRGGQGRSGGRCRRAGVGSCLGGLGHVVCAVSLKGGGDLESKAGLPPVIAGQVIYTSHPCDRKIQADLGRVYVSTADQNILACALHLPDPPRHRLFRSKGAAQDLGSRRVALCLHEIRSA